MTFFESLLGLLLVAVLLLQFARRLLVPYPTMLAAAGVLLAQLPGAPEIGLDPRTALAVLVAPALMDAAFDFPIAMARRFWLPVVSFAVLGVLATAVLVAWIGWAVAGLPFALALALGAIVAPPDAAAAVAVLNTVAIPRDTETVLKGESLFNDATALLLLGAALSVQQAGALDTAVAVRLAVAAPGGIALGIAFAFLMMRVGRFVGGTLGGNVLQFVMTYLAWVVAEHLGLSAVLSVVAFGMTLAWRSRGAGRSSARMRVHSYAVWATVVFLLNVLAFLLMGMQARAILHELHGVRLADAFSFGGLVVAVVVVGRIAFVVAFNRLIAWRFRRRGEAPPASLRQALLVGWSGMRGLVTLAAALSLPQGLPHREVMVLTAFLVVLATLVLQGLTLRPLIRLLDLDHGHVLVRETAAARRTLCEAARVALGEAAGEEADYLRFAYRLSHASACEPPDTEAFDRRRALGLKAIASERQALARMRAAHEIGDATYGVLQEELDWREIVLLPDEERQIEQT